MLILAFLAFLGIISRSLFNAPIEPPSESKLEKSVSRLENEIYNNAYQDNEIYNDEFTKKLHNILSEKDNKIIYEKNR